MTPSVNQNVPPPPGNLPRNRYTYLILGVALLIVLAVVFTTPGAAPATAPSLRMPNVVPPTKSEIDRYRQQLRRRRPGCRLRNRMPQRRAPLYNSRSERPDSSNSSQDRARIVLILPGTR